jgi:FkbM family methyltransferase
VAGVARYARWQMRRLLNRFPTEVAVGRSVLIAQDRLCSVSSLVAVHGLYDFNNMSLFRLLMHSARGVAFYDIGANIGVYSLIATEESVNVAVAVEPHPVTAARLLANVKRNGRRNIRVVPVAASDREGSMHFSDKRIASVNSLDEHGLLVVECKTVESIARKLGVVPDFVKIDVEGWEWEVLHGFGEFLADILVLAVELNESGAQRGHSERDIAEMLNRRGLVGPFWCDFENRRVVKTVFSEDPLFFSKRGINMMAGVGFSFNG